MSPELIEAGKNYVRAGLTVIPVNARKKPAIKEWTSFENGRRTTLEDIEEWSKLHYVRGWALICGPPSDNVGILDFDVPGFYEKWAALVGDLAKELPTQQTGSGDGRQVAFKSSLNLRNDKLAYSPVDNKEGREIAIETRGAGGYAVLPPSFCPQAEKRGMLHKQAYKTIQGDFTKIPTIPPQEAQRLLEAARSLCQAPLSLSQMKVAPITPRNYGNNENSGVIDKFNEANEVGSILERNGYERRGNRYLAPDSTTGEPGVYIFSDTGRCYSHHGNDPLNDGHSHDPFSVFTILEHGGDVRAAVKAAAEALGIERPKGSLKQEAPRSNGPQASKEPPVPLQWPKEVMTGAAGRFAESYANYLETPEPFLYMAYLTYLGHVISNRITLQSELTPEPRLFTILLGESAIVRKSTSISKTNRFFQEVISPDDLNTIWGVGSAEGLAKCFTKNKRAILILDELKSLIQKMRIDASVLLPCINTLFESKHYHNNTKKGGIAIDDAELCLLAASTLDTYSNMFNSTFTDIGFLNRLFVVIGDSQRKFPIPESMPQDTKDILKSDLKEVLSFVGEITKRRQYAMPINSTARDIFEEWYFNLEPSVFASRLDTYGHRLMPLLAVNEMLDLITPEIAEKTVTLLNYQLAARKYADPIDADNAIARLEGKIRQLLAGGTMPKRDLERRGNKNRVGIWAWDQAIKNLRNDGAIFWDSKKREFRFNDRTDDPIGKEIMHRLDTTNKERKNGK